MKVEKVFLRTEHNYDRDAASDESGLDCKDPSLAQQSARDETDINVIVKKFGLTGHMPQGLRIPRYGDFDQVDDFRVAYEMVAMADHAFLQLPAEVRVKFNNDPAAFVNFCEDPKNLDELRKMGLAITPTPVPGQSIPANGTPQDEPGKVSKDGKA